MEEQKINKYICEKYNFKCNIASTSKYNITSNRYKKSDYKEPIKCDYCNYETKNITTLKMHKLNNHSTIEEIKKEFKYYCSYCDFGCLYKNFMIKHNKTIKHKYKMSKILLFFCGIKILL